VLVLIGDVVCCISIDSHSSVEHSSSGASSSEYCKDHTITAVLVAVRNCSSSVNNEAVTAEVALTTIIALFNDTAHLIL
jgi:hypothetical protein